MNELFVECLQVGVGESLRIGDYFVADIDRSGVVDDRGFQGEPVLAEGTAVIADHDFRRKPILALAHDFVAVIKHRTRARYERAAHDHARRRRTTQEGRQLRPVTGPRIFFQRQLVRGNARQILPFEVNGPDQLAPECGIGAGIDLAQAAHGHALG